MMMSIDKSESLPFFFFWDMNESEPQKRREGVLVRSCRFFYFLRVLFAFLGGESFWPSELPEYISSVFPKT
jgi:hypothetical protein